MSAAEKSNIKKTTAFLIMDNNARNIVLLCLDRNRVY